MPKGKQFDLLVITLCLLTNLCEHCPENRTRIVHLDIVKPAVVNPVTDAGSDTDEQQLNPDGEDEENGGDRKRGVKTTSALDELVQV